MTNTVDTVIEALNAARAEHNLVFSKGPARAELSAIRKANDAIGAARELAFAALGIPIHSICNDALLDKLRNHPGAISK